MILNTDSINPIPGYAYLSVYNYQDWIPVQWGKIKDQQVTFDKMGKDIVYLPTYYVKGKSIPAGQPFWLKSDGTLQRRKGTSRNSQFCGSSTVQREQEESDFIKRKRTLGNEKREKR